MDQVHFMYPEPVRNMSWIRFTTCIQIFLATLQWLKSWLEIFNFSVQGACSCLQHMMFQCLNKQKSIYCLVKSWSWHYCIEIFMLIFQTWQNCKIIYHLFTSHYCMVQYYNLQHNMFHCCNKHHCMDQNSPSRIAA